MEAVRESAEHHFIGKIDTIKVDPSGWMAFRLSLSSNFSHADFIRNSAVDGLRRLASARRKAETFFQKVCDRLREDPSATVWLFADNDVVFLARALNATGKQTILSHFRMLSTQDEVQGVVCEALSADMYELQKFADEKLLSARRMSIYDAMADLPRVRSIDVRRKRRTEPLILIVEDDRFTASYTASILGNSYDIIHARTGEEGIIAHIEHAPDAVFLDIHLPGLSGHDVLQSIRNIDPKAFITMLSIDSEKTGVLSASENGAVGFLKKPVSKERLMAAAARSPFIRKNQRHTPYERETHLF